mmetsp:Transcript_122525/g.183220  ORF Transcript_122525/g.183220 Transcript_122525/m.183220 type:complete len:310 (+) Transcript_122525:217-1146(+)
MVLVNGVCSLDLPQDRDDVTIMSIPNMGSDFAAFGEALAAFGYTPDGARQNLMPACDSDQTDPEPGPESESPSAASSSSDQCRVFSHFVLINSSCRGPFIPPFLRGIFPWTFPFTSKLTRKVKLVAPSMHFIPAYSTEAAFCDPAKSNLWERINITGAGPRVDGYMHATDVEGLKIFLQEDIYRVFPDWASAVNLGEYGLSRAILERGYSLACLVAQFQGVDWSDPANWPGPKGLLGAATINQVRTQWHDTPKLIYAPQPYETVFIKTRWGESYTQDKVPLMDSVGEESALAFARMTEELYSAFDSPPP